MIRYIVLLATVAAATQESTISEIKQKAVDYIISNQKDDGSFKLPELGVDAQPFGIYAVAGLAIISEKGISDEVVKLAKYYMKIQDADGMFVLKGGGYHRANLQQGYCILFLEELLLREKEKGFPFSKQEVKEIKAAVEKALRYLEKTQHETGAWTYDPRQKDPPQLGTYKESATSVGIMHSIAVARRLGFEVDEDTVRNGVKYFIQRQHTDGGFINGDWERTSSLHMTSGCLYALTFYTKYPEVNDSVKHAEAYIDKRNSKRYLTNDYPKDGFARRRVMYGHMYSALLNKSNKEMVMDILMTMVKGSKDEGIWSSSISKVGATSFALISLNVRKKPLKVFEPYTVEPQEVWH